MKLLILMVALSCWFSLVLPLKDVLDRSMCKSLKEKGMCKSRFKCIKDELCKVSCGCNDMLSVQSCKVLKRIKQCINSWGVGFRYCKWTCQFCWRTPSCKSAVALGMQSKAIPDSSITASGYHSKGHEPQQGRLHLRSTISRGKAGAWVAKTRRAGEWLQVDLGKVTVIRDVATQGRYEYKQWVTSYTLQYSNNGKTFKNYQGGKVFKGNRDRHTVVKHNLNPPIYARYIRVVDKTWYGWPAIRMELYGCKYY